VTLGDPFAAPETEKTGFSDYIPVFFRRGSEFWRWVSLIALSTTTVMGIGLLVVGTGLVGSGLVIVASGFDVVDIAMAPDLGTALAVGLVVTLIGAFATGFAVEGPVGYKIRRFEAKSWELALAVVPGFFIVKWSAGWLASQAERFLAEFPEAFDVVGAQLQAVGDTAIGWPLIVAVVLLYVIHEFVLARFARVEYQTNGVIYFVWLLATVSAYPLFV